MAASRLAWKPALAGLAALAAGAWLATRGWGLLAQDATDTAGLAQLAAGVLLALVGALAAAVPLLVPVLYKLYGPGAFSSRGGACPVVAKCARCGEFNFRGRPACKGCGAGLLGGPGAAAEAPSR